MKTVIVLFCDDFRIKDNPALYNASIDFQNIIPLYIFNEKYLGNALGSASKIFLHKTLESFNNLLQKEYKTNLVIKHGDVIEILKEIIKNEKIDGIYFNKSYTKTQIEQENEINNQFKNIKIKSFLSKILFNPKDIKPSSGGDFYKVFTPFAKECFKKRNLIEDSLPMPKKITSIHGLQSEKIENLNLFPKNQGNWHQNLIKNWSFSYDEIESNFIDFVDNKLEKYKDDRNIPSQNNTSKISPYLRFGMLSPRICFNISTFVNPENQFSLEILWREFAYHVLFYNHDIKTKELRSEYKNFIWENDLNFITKWKKGQTGFDIVDAGMTELWKTGTMHNRVRMIVASFLIKDLLIDWKIGEDWFWETLVDADPAINPFSWQWVFGSGFDSAPYFRIFNPESQKIKFDPDSTYCKKWLQNTSKISKIVNHDIQRKITLQKYKNL